MRFVAEHVSRTQEIHLHAPPSRVFPLFEPIGEKLWAADWNPTMLFPASGATEAGAVFTTRHPAGGETIWLVSSYDPANLHIAYVRVTPGERVGIVDVQCQGAEDGMTRAAVTYTYTALSQAGNDFLKGFTTEHYQHEMSLWERAINYYLEHGEALRHH